LLENESSWAEDMAGATRPTGEVGMVPDPLWMLLGPLMEPEEEMRSIDTRFRHYVERRVKKKSDGRKAERGKGTGGFTEKWKR